MRISRLALTIRISRLAALVLVSGLCALRPAAAQSVPDGSLRIFDGQLVVSGEAEVTISEEDEEAFFNYTDYEHNALRMFRLSLAGAWQPVRRFAFVGEVRTENFDQPTAYAAYARIRPWVDRDFDIQIGRIPPSFGAYSRRVYASDNTVIGYPLAYQYLASIHPDAVPATAADLLRMRGRGWLSNFPVGDATPSPGVPLVSAFRWDTGAQVRWKTSAVELTGAVTRGTLSDPRFKDNNHSPQVSGRVTWTPTVGLVMGASGAHGAWLDDNVIDLIPNGRSHYGQTAWGADAEYSRDHWIVRTEMVWSRWLMPLAATRPSGINLDAFGAWVEGRYKWTPRFFTAARVDHLGFNRVAGEVVSVDWDAPVTRVEGAIGYYLQRNLVARLGVQYNDRDGGRVHSRTYVAAKLAFWF
jgi:hypothetical protein